VIRKVRLTLYELKLPETINIHPVFHSNLLRRDPNDFLPGQIQEIPPPIVIDGEKEWEIVRLLDLKLYYGRFQYRVE
jgi:hypothetical protein